MAGLCDVAFVLENTLGRELSHHCPFMRGIPVGPHQPIDGVESFLRGGGGLLYVAEMLPEVEGRFAAQHASDESHAVVSGRNRKLGARWFVLDDGHLVPRMQRGKREVYPRQGEREPAPVFYVGEA